MAKLKLSLLNIVYIIQLIVVGLIIVGILPRYIYTVFIVWLVLYIVYASLEDSTAFFVRSIPLFIAIPFSMDFDQFNAWRIISFLIFIKWLIIGGFNNALFGLKEFFKKPISFIKFHPFIFSSGVLLIMAVLSLIAAPDLTAGVKRIIYFINLSLVGVVIYDLAVKNRGYIKGIIKNITVPVVLVAAIGFIQLGMTYMMDIFQFVDVWGRGIECRLFGAEWGMIA